MDWSWHKGVVFIDSFLADMCPCSCRSLEKEVKSQLTLTFQGADNPERDITNIHWSADIFNDVTPSHLLYCAHRPCLLHQILGGSQKIIWTVMLPYNLSHLSFFFFIISHTVTSWQWYFWAPRHISPGNWFLTSHLIEGVRSSATTCSQV